MKKRKIGFMLNIFTICLAVVALVIGVYALQQANLNINGSVGFVAHNCNADITIKTNGDSIDANGNRVENGTTARTTAEILQVAVKTGETIGLYGDKTEVRGADLELSLKPFYFCDMTTDGTIQDITLTFEITNQSDYAIVAQISSITAANNVKFYISNGTTLFSDSRAEKIILETKGEKNTITIICKYTAAVDFNSNLRIALSLSKKTVTPINFSMSTTDADILKKFPNMITSFTANENETWSEYICRMGYICDGRGVKDNSGGFVRYNIGYSEEWESYIYLFTKNTKNSTKSLLSFTAADIDGTERVAIYTEIDYNTQLYWVMNGSNEVAINTDKIVEGANYTFS